MLSCHTTVETLQLHLSPSPQRLLYNHTDQLYSAAAALQVDINHNLLVDVVQSKLDSGMSVSYHCPV